MKKQILVLSFLLISSFVFLPVQGSAAPASDPSAVTKASPQIQVQIGRRHSREWYMRHRYGRYGNNDYYGNRMARRRYYGNNGYYANRSARFYRNSSGMVRQVYYVNGRRYVRWVRSY
jgi:hypothetical protein